MKTGFLSARTVTVALLVMAGASCLDAQPKRIYIANDDHTDYLWAADESANRQAFLQMLDYYLDLADQTDNLSPDFQSRFNTDGSYWLWTYEHNRTPEKFARLIDRVRDGHITIPLQTLVLCYGTMPTEAVLRSMYYPGRIERRYDLRFELACAMENQTLPYGLPSLWAGSGARYSWKGVCGCATKVTGLTHRLNELYHAVGPDGRSVLMKWHSLTSSTSSGGYAEARNPAAAVQFAATNATFLSRYPADQVVGMFGKGWDDLSTLTNVFPTVAETSSTPTQRVIVSNEVDFFKDVESSVPSDSIPSWSGGFGNEWDMYTATMADVTASVRRAVEQLRTAEAMTTVVAVTNPSLVADRSASADSVFQSLGLYFEHCWTADGAASSGRADYQRRLAAQIAGYASTLDKSAGDALGTLIARSAPLSRYYVFNPLGWTRTDVADIPYDVAGPVKVIDVRTTAEVRSQHIVRNGVSLLRVLVPDVPSAGYCVLEIRQDPSAITDSCAQSSNNGATLENDKYAVTINGRGALTSIIDKRDGGRELVRSIGGLAVNDLGTGSGTPVLESNGPVCASMVVDAGGSPSHRVRVTVYRDIDRIDLEDEIVSNFGNTITAYAFGFNLDQCTIRHEEVGGIATAKTISQGGNYADANARYSYLTMNHFVDLSESGRGVTISNWDSPLFKPGSSTDNVLDGSTPQIRALVGGRIDPTLGIANQGGSSYFLNRYALARHGAYDQAAAMRMALEHQNPLRTGKVEGGVTSPLPEAAYSLLSLSNPAVMLWTLKPAEEGIGSGIILRLWNCSTSQEAFSLSFGSATVTSAQRTSHIETNTGPAGMAGAAVAETLPSQWMQTYRVTLEGPTGVPTRPPVPQGYQLEQNFPNPFNGESQVRFHVPVPGHVRLRLFNILGQKVGVLFDRTVPAGSYSASIDSESLRISSGMYFCTMETDRFSRTIKVVIIR